MKKKLLNLFAISIISSIGFLGCTDSIDDITGDDGTPNKTILNVDNMPSEFVISTSANNFSDYYHVSHSIVDNSGSELLNKGINYKGTVTTTCSSTVSSSIYQEYQCITKWNTESPIGDPQDETNTIKIYDASSYKVILSEYSFSNGKKETEIGSIPQ